MSHEITKTDHLFTVRTAPWHGLGTVVEDAPDSTTALKLARLDWSVCQTPCLYEIDGKQKTFPTRFINYRSDTGEALGCVGVGYQIVQNAEAFAFTDHLLGEGVRYETAGSIKGGRNVWMLAKLPPERILGDEIAPYLLFANGHDGQTAVQVCMTPIRVVCNNTLNLALNGAMRKWSFYHSGNFSSRISDAAQTLQLVGRYMKTLAVQAERLATEKISQTEIHRFVETLFPIKGGKTAETNAKNRIERFHACYHADDVENFRGTKWGLLLAMSDYTSHILLRNDKQRERHFAKTVLAGAELLDKAFTMVG